MEKDLDDYKKVLASDSCRVEALGGVSLVTHSHLYLVSFYYNRNCTKQCRDGSIRGQCFLLAFLR